LTVAVDWHARATPPTRNVRPRRTSTLRRRPEARRPFGLPAEPMANLPCLHGLRGGLPIRLLLIAPFPSDANAAARNPVEGNRHPYGSVLTRKNHKTLLRVRKALHLPPRTEAKPRAGASLLMRRGALCTLHVPHAPGFFSMPSTFRNTYASTWRFGIEKRLHSC
jgi:hypothetical protein